MTLTMVFFVLYMIAMLTIGAVASRRVQSKEDYALAGRNLGWFYVMCSGAATQTGAAATLTVVALTYNFGAQAIWWQVSNAVVFILFTYTVAKPFRESEVSSIGMFAGKMYDRKSRVLVSLITGIAGVGYVAAQISGMATLLASLTSLSFEQGAMVGGAVVILYTVLGGLFAVAVTDVAQLAVVGLGMIGVIAFSMKQYGSMGTLSEKVGEQLNPFWDSFSGVNCNSFLWFVSMVISWFVARCTAQNFFMFSAGAKDAKTAKLGSNLGAVWPIVFGVMAVTIGLYAKSFVPEAPGDNAMPYLIINVLPPVLAALLIAGIAAACMSTADSNLNGAAVTITEEIKYWFKIKDEHLLNATRIATIVVGVLAVLMVVWLKGIYQLLTFSFNLGAPVTPALVAAVYYKRCTKNGAFWSMLLGSVITLVFQYGMPEQAAVVMPVVVGFVSAIVILVVISEIETAVKKGKKVA